MSSLSANMPILPLREGSSRSFQLVIFLPTLLGSYPMPVMPDCHAIV